MDLEIADKKEMQIATFKIIGKVFGQA